MKNFWLTVKVLACFVLFGNYSNGQNVGISDDGASFTPDNSSVLELKSTSRGLLAPRMTTAQRTAITSPATGLLVYDTTVNSFWMYNSSAWTELVESSSSDTLIINTPVIFNDTVILAGDGLVWNDICVAVTSTTRGGSKDPTFAVIKDNGAGSQGVFTFFFDQTIEEEVYFSVEMPHGWKEESDIKPHVHWFPVTDLSSTNVEWGLEYFWTNVAATIPNTTIINSYTPIAAHTPVTAYKHVITELGTISGTGKTISSILMCRVYRIAGSVNDDYADDAGVLQIDFLYQSDQLGSTGEYSK